MDEGSEEKPEPGEDRSRHRDRPENRPDDPRDQVKEKPDAAKDDGLHRVEANEAVLLFENVKNQAADKRNAGEGGGNIRGEAGRSCGRRVRRSWCRVDWIWHATFRGTRGDFVKGSRAC